MDQGSLEMLTHLHLYLAVKATVRTVKSRGLPASPRVVRGRGSVRRCLVPGVDPERVVRAARGDGSTESALVVARLRG